MQTQQTITLFCTVSNSATSRISKNGHKYTAFGVAIISDRNPQVFHYNVVAFGKQGHFAKPLQTGTRIKIVVQAQSQPDNIATLPLLTATFVRPVRRLRGVGTELISAVVEHHGQKWPSPPAVTETHFAPEAQDRNPTNILMSRISAVRICASGRFQGTTLDHYALSKLYN
jgi:hypothetical protein